MALSVGEVAYRESRVHRRIDPMTGDVAERHPIMLANGYARLPYNSRGVPPRVRAGRSPPRRDTFVPATISPAYCRTTGKTWSAGCARPMNSSRTPPRRRLACRSRARAMSRPIFTPLVSIGASWTVRWSGSGALLAIAHRWRRSAHVGRDRGKTAQ
jgi:hypothetical protein